MNGSPMGSKAASELMMIGRPGSAVIVIWRNPVVVRSPSVTINVTAVLPAVVGMPEMIPVTASALKPGGRFWAVNLESGLPLRVITRKLKNCPTRPVAAVLLVITGPTVGIG